jgi:hypothetical protein
VSRISVSFLASFAPLREIPSFIPMGEVVSQSLRNRCHAEQSEASAFHWLRRSFMRLR